MERPILFNTEMVQAILSGRKTQTRRIIKQKYENADIEWFTNKYGTRLVYMQNDVPEPVYDTETGTTKHKMIACEEIKKPCNLGDILWVRETWFYGDILDDNEDIKERGIYLYRADKQRNDIDYELMKWSPSIHMPRKAARLFLKVISVKAERLQDMNFYDWKVDFCPDYVEQEKALASFTGHDYMVQSMKNLWDNIYLQQGYGWDTNPWVWVIEFGRMGCKDETES